MILCVLYRLNITALYHYLFGLSCTRMSVPLHWQTTETSIFFVELNIIFLSWRFTLLLRGVRFWNSRCFKKGNKKMAITEPYATTTQLNMQNRSIYLGFALFPSFHVRNVVQQKQTVFYPTFPCRWFEPFFFKSLTTA